MALLGASLSSISALFHPLPQLFAFLGFLTSALWINAAATEVVNILRSLGVVFWLSNTVLGLTLLAWGNSIGGDLGPGPGGGGGAGGLWDEHSHITAHCSPSQNCTWKEVSRACAWSRCSVPVVILE